MKLCMTLLVRDEAPIVRDTIEYHLARGVDFIIATDNRSVDGTGEILREYEREGRLRYIFEADDDYSQDLWVTRMARLAAVEHGADWVMHVDADEFWWPEGKHSLKDVLAGVPDDVDGVLVSRSNFVPLNDDSPALPFQVRMTVRERRSLNANGRPLPGKVAHRADPGVSVAQGNHAFHLETGSPNVLSIDEEDVLIFHYPMRDFDQFRHKIAVGGAAYERNTRLPVQIGSTWRTLYERERSGTLREWFDEQAWSRAAVQEGVSSGALLYDRRLAEFMSGLERRRRSC